MRLIGLLLSHGAALALGFGLGVYFLPILTAEKADQSAIQEIAASAVYTAEIREGLPGNDALHWGEGTVTLSATAVAHSGRLAPGPDYKLYLAPRFVEDEASFEAVKTSALRVGDVKSFDGFSLPLPEGVDLEAYTTVVIWCEAFGEFIAAAEYR